MTEAERVRWSTRALEWARAWGPTTLWLAVLFILSEQPGDTRPGWWTLPDTVSHAILYSVLGATLIWGRRVLDDRPHLVALGIAGLVLAVFDEWHQSFVPGRTPSASDVAFDALGLVLGGAVALLAFRYLPLGPDRHERNP
ncbi:MAG TPA: VanZ family protein [Myxococcota bacterium]|nr:VanZ family protein [Myxococcota bacterium]HKK91912.1 VanZ family protein [Longimicrobiales bacterium]